MDERCNACKFAELIAHLRHNGDLDQSAVVAAAQTMQIASCDVHTIIVEAEKLVPEHLATRLRHQKDDLP